ncbi:MAG TPA: tetratricopeptide repeat protein, partial [Anaerolineae bacterium]|nr:tetratricopeptide repeat protein [Anaerolineae bacterium]
MDELPARIATLRAWNPTLRTIALLAFVPVLLTIGRLMANFAPLLAVIASWLWFMLPGSLLSSVLLRRLSWLERVPVAFVLGAGLAAPYTVLATLLRLRLEQLLGLSVGMLILMGLILVIYNFRSERTKANRPDNSPEVALGRFEVGMIPYLCLLILVGGILAFLSARALLTGDDVAAFPYFEEVLRLGKITGTEPFHGTGTPVMPRNELIVGGYQSILLCKLAGTSVVSFLLGSRPILVVLALLAFYTFVHQVFKDRRQALFLVSLWSVYLLATTQYDGAGEQFALHIFQDKYYGWFIAVPVVLVFLQWFLESRQPRYLVGLGLGAFGLALLHPVLLMQVLILGGSFGLLYLAFEHSRRAFFSLLAVGLVLGLCVVVPAVQYFRYLERMPIEVAGLGDALEFGRIFMGVARYRIWLVNGSQYVMHPSLILSPVNFLGYALLPVLAFRLGKSNAARLIVGSMLALLFILYIPPLFAIVGKFVTPFLMWRLGWPVPMFSILTVGWVIWVAASRLSSLMEKRGGRVSIAIRHGCPLAVVALALLLARPSIEAGRVNLGERLSDQDFSTCSKSRDAILYLDRLSPQEPIDVLASSQLNSCIPAYAPLANVVEYRGYGTVNRLPVEQIPQSLQRLDDATYFGAATMVDDLVLAAIERHDIDYVLVEKDRIYLDLQFRHLPDIFRAVYVDGDYAIYAVNKPLPHSFVIDGNSALRQGRWDVAETIFTQALEEDESQVLAQVGMASVHEGKGELTQVLASYLEARRSAEQEPAIHVRLGETYLLLREADHAVAEYQEAVALDPARESLHASLGLAYLLAGATDAAEASFEDAAALQSKVGTATYYSVLGDTMMSASWSSQAVHAYQESIASEPNPSRYVDLAQALAQSGDPVGAVRADTQAIRDDPWLELPHLHLGDLHRSQGELDAAIQEYDRAWRLGPTNNAVFAALAQALRERLGVLPAIGRLESLATLNRVIPGPHRALAPLFEAKGDVGSALTELGLALSVQPKDASIEVAIGDLLREDGQIEQARQAYDEALAIDPNMVYAHIGIGHLHGRAGELDLQLGQVLSVARSEPSTAGPRIALADIYKAEGDLEASREEIRWAVRLEPRNSAGYVALGNLQASRTDWQAAISSFDRAIALLPANVEARLGLGYVYQALGDLTEARVSFETAAEMSPGAANVLVALGDVYRLEGDLSEAAAQYQRATEAEPGHAAAYLGLSAVHQARGDLAAASATLEKAVKVLPSSPEIYGALAELAMRCARASDALSWAQRSVEANPQEAGSYMALAEVHEQLGHWDSAAEACKQAIQLEPTVIDGHIRLATLHEARGDFAAATAEFLAGTEAVPWSGLGYAALGDHYARRGETERAMGAYREAVSVEPAYVDAYGMLADLYSATGRFDEALALHQSATEVSPGTASAWISLGDYHRQRGHHELSLSAYQQAVRVAPGSASAWLGFGLAYQSLGRVEEAADTYRCALSLEPGSVSAYLALGQLQEAQLDREAAEALYRQAIAAAPGDPRSYLSLSDVYAALGQREKAWEELEAAVQVAPGNPSPLLSRGDWYRTGGQYDEAERAYQQALEVAPTYVDAYLALARLEQARLDRDAAQQLYQQAIAAAPTDPRAYLLLGNLYATMGQPQKALAEFQAAVQAAPADAPALVALGDWHRMRGDRQLAEHAYRQALQAAPAEVAAYVALGQLEEAQLDRQSAEQLYLQAVDVAPAAPDAYLSLGHLYALQTNMQQALKQFEKATEVAPSSVQAHIALATLHEAQNDRPAAERLYRQTMDIAPANPSGYIALGQLYAIEGRDQEALEQLQRAIDVAPAYPQPYVMLGDFYQNRGDWQQAEALYQQAIAVAPGEGSEALQLEEEADQETIELVTGPLSAYLALGQLKEKLGDRSEAREFYSQAIAVAP